MALVFTSTPAGVLDDNALAETQDNALDNALGDAPGDALGDAQDEDIEPLSNLPANHKLLTYKYDTLNELMEDFYEWVA